MNNIKGARIALKKLTFDEMITDHGKTIGALDKDEYVESTDVQFDEEVIIVKADIKSRGELN